MPIGQAMSKAETQGMSTAEYRQSPDDFTSNRGVAIAATQRRAQVGTSIGACLSSSATDAWPMR